MAVRYFAAAAVAIACGALLWWFMADPTHELPVRTIAVGNAPVVVEVAETPVARERGLGGRTSLPQGRGMLFVFDSDAAWGIWMKDMRFAIDIVWLATDGTVVHVERAVAPDTYPTSFKPPMPARYVLELPAGYMAAVGVGVGERVVL